MSLRLFLLFVLLIEILQYIVVPTSFGISSNYLFPPKENVTLAGKYMPYGVNPNPYTSEPAPMGIADIGIGPNGPFIRETTQFKGIIYLYSLSAESSLNNSCVGFQLNVVLNYNYKGNTYALWIQDVALFNTQNNYIIFLDNIWNFTTFDANVSGVSGNGELSNYNGVYYYYYFAPGNGVYLSLPSTIYLLVNVTTNSYGQPVINFWYNDGYGWVEYDSVTVTNVYNASNVYFLIDGYQYTGYGNYYDAELVLVGPGGGSCAYLYESQVYLSLQYWNGHNFQTVRNAYNHGYDTAETTNNANVGVYYYPSNGEYVSGITAGFGTPGELWNQDSVSTLIINTGVSSGYVLVFNASVPYSDIENYPSFYEIPFTNGEVCLTLDPMEYGIVVYSSNGQIVGEANVITDQGSTVSTNVEPFKISVLQSSISGSTATVTFNIQAYGYVTFYVNSSFPYSFQSNPVYINGEGTDILTIYDLSPGNYEIIVYASLFEGFYCEINLNLHIGIPKVPVTFSLTVIGQAPPISPTITFTFPNGSTEVLPIFNGETINVPQGTTYDIQQVISEGNIRWATNNVTSGTINNLETLNIVYYEQFKVNFSYKLIGNGDFGNPTITYYCFNIQKTAIAPATVWVDYDSVYEYSQILPGSNSQSRAIANNFEGVVYSPETVIVYYQVQYYIVVNSSIPLYALVNGENVSFTSNWYNESASIQIENMPYYISPTEREIIVSVSPNSFIIVDSPETVNVKTITQYYIDIKSPIPIYGIINGINETLTSNWYNESDKIIIENITYYPNKFTRDIITSVMPSRNIIVNSSIEISIITLTQYYINVNSSIPIYALVNGNNVSLNSNWYNSGLKIEVENLTYYPKPNERYVITYISPESFTLNSPVNITVKVIEQFLVSVSSKIPIKALINGSETLLNSSWINKGTKVYIINYTYYVNSKEREIIVNITPSQSFTVNSPVTVNVKTQRQYLVTIDNISSWYSAGATIMLNANIPFYMVGKFIGTYNASPGSIIVVNQPIEEKLVESPNYLVIGSLLSITIVTVIAILFIKKYK